MVLLHSSVLRISATFHLNTPLFAGGAEPMTADAELRPSEIKAALRFWWRAANYSLYLQDKVTYSPYLQDRLTFAETEAMLFGSAEYGQGVLLHLEPYQMTKGLSPPAIHPEFTEDSGRAGARYLAYELMEFAYRKPKPATDTKPAEPAKFAGQLKRPYINPGFQFTINLIWKPNKHGDKVALLTTQHAQKDLVQAIRLFGLFGGLGSRSRRGFGSVTLTNLTINGVVEDKVDSPPTTLETYIEQLKKFQEEWSSVATEQDVEAVEYSALTRHSEISLITRPQNLGVSDANSVLNAIGSAFVRYRSNGREMSNYRILEVHEKGSLKSTEFANRFFMDDHDFLRAPKKSRHLQKNPVHLPDRTVFGLPHPYGKDGIIGGHQQRRASPLLVHVHYCTAENTYIGVLLTMPAKFFPRAVEISGFQDLHPHPVPPGVQWSVLSNFLRGLLPPAPITTKTKFLKPPFDPMQVTPL